MTPEREITRTRNNVRQLLFHEESIDERTDIRMHGDTDVRTHNPKPICPVNFFEVGGMINNKSKTHKKRTNIDNKSKSQQKHCFGTVSKNLLGWWWGWGGGLKSVA